MGQRSMDRKHCESVLKRETGKKEKRDLLLNVQSYELLPIFCILSQIKRERKQSLQNLHPVRSRVKDPVRLPETKIKTRVRGQGQPRKSEKQ